MQYHIMNMVPAKHATGMLHGLYGHAEVIETIGWGLTELGHSVTIGNNSYRGDCRNIVFGAQVMDLPFLEQMSPETIIYNFEQIATLEPDDIRRSLHYIADRFQIWDYDSRNLDAWRRLDADCDVTVVPVGWSPTLTRISKRADEDIDVLLYGIPGPARHKAFHNLCQTGLKCVFACGLYGASRDDLISRSKLVLNINNYELSRVFEIVRVSYLLANGKAVVSDIFQDSVVDSDLRDAVAFCPQESVAQTCVKLIADDAARNALAVRGQAVMERRDIREILRPVLLAEKQR